MKVLLIGHGYWGSKILTRLESALGRDSIYVADKDVSKISTLKNVVSDSYKSLLDDVDACVVATPINTHYNIVRDCLFAGKDVLSEKPLTTSYGDATVLNNIAKEKHLILYTDLTFLYDYRLLQAIGYGLPTLMQWQGKSGNHPEDTVWWSWGPHLVSILLKLSHGVFPANVSGFIRDGYARVVYLFENRPVVLYLDWDNNVKIRSITYNTGYTLSLSNIPFPDPLFRVIRHFLYATRKRNIPYDNIHIDTVRLLEWTQQSVLSDSLTSTPSTSL